MLREHEFYHGTSSLFIESIFKNRLGGVNPNLKFKNLELLKFIYGQCENTLFNEEKYSVLMRETTLAMIRQTDLIVRRENKMTEKDKFLNFQYMNFGLKRPVEIERQEVYEIKYSGNIRERDFEYKLVEYEKVYS